MRHGCLSCWSKEVEMADVLLHEGLHHQSLREETETNLKIYPFIHLLLLTLKENNQAM